MTHNEPAFDRSPLLDALRSDSAVDADALGRVRERVTSTVTAAHVAALGQSRAASRPTSLAPQPALPQRPWRASLTGLAAALAVGTALGAGGHAVLSAYVTPMRTHAPAPRKPETTSVPARRAAPQAAPVSSAALPSEPEALPNPPELEPARPIAGTASAEPHGLDAELQQLERARTALGRGQPDQALSLLAAHAQRYPSSMLVQERDALNIKALVAAGRHAEARAAGDRFGSRYPDSLLLDAVKASLATIP